MGKGYTGSEYFRKGANALGYSLDPGGLLWTSKDPQIAGAQTKVDVLGIGADPVVATREAEKIYEEQVEKAETAAAKEQRLVEAQTGIESERKRRADLRRAQRISRGSLLTTDEGLGETLG